MTPVRNEVFTGLEHRSCYLVGGGGGEPLVGGGRGFQKAFRSRGILPPLWDMANFAGWWFFIGWWKSEEWFRPFEPYTNLKKNSVNNEHQSQNYHELSVQRVWC